MFKPIRRHSTVNIAHADKVRNKAGRFRVLIIGRANSGKTTILKKVCNSADDPAIYSTDGGEIDLSVLRPTRSRGLHDIDNEMIFKSNPHFIFHDSHGFEAGNTKELKFVKNFLVQRAKKRRLRDLPVIVLFTKLDALDDKGFQMLLNENPDITHDDAVDQAPIRAQQIFEEMLPTLRIFKSRYPPENHVEAPFKNGNNE
ncbi:hypothetical protein H0H87_006621 [Tephrocybe sp. NHM501043]|nr:hypothetical protein H0H87_006621 [Tephrocybe sp. NHM501043]